MSTRVTSGRDGELRLYDATPSPGTPKFLSIKFEQMNLSGAMARPRPLDPVIATVGGALMAPTSADYDAGFFEGIPVSFSLWVNSVDYMPIRAALSNLDNANPWKVGQDTWQSTKGRGSVIMPDGNYKSTPLFFDEKKRAVDIQARWTSPAMSGSIMGQRWDEAYFAPQNVAMQESADYLEIRCTALVYGNIEPIGDFSFGVSSI